MSGFDKRNFHDMISFNNYVYLMKVNEPEILKEEIPIYKSKYDRHSSRKRSGNCQYVYHDLKRILKIQDMKENALNVERSFKKI